METRKNDFVYMPPKMYAFLVRFGEEYNLSVREVLNTILRHGMEGLGFKCEHLDIRAAKSNGKPYCHNCWTRMRQVSPGAYDFKGKMKTAPKYEVLPTFMNDENLWFNLHMNGSTFPVERKRHTITKEDKNSPLYDI